MTPGGARPTAEAEYRAAYRARQFRRLVVLAFLTGALAVLWPARGQAQMTPAVARQDAVRLTPVLYVSQVTPPPEYARWYAAAERCVGMKGKYKAVRWYLTPLPWTDGKHDGMTYGMWQGGHRITLNTPDRMDSTLVNHEAIHDILAVNGKTSLVPHPPEFFGPTRCTYEFHP